MYKSNFRYVNVLNRSRDRLRTRLMKVRIIYFYYLFFHLRPIQCCVFIPVGLSPLTRYFQQVLWVFKFEAITSVNNSNFYILQFVVCWSGSECKAPSSPPVATPLFRSNESYSHLPGCEPGPVERQRH